MLFEQGFLIKMLSFLFSADDVIVFHENNMVIMTNAHEVLLFISEFFPSSS